MPNTLKLTMKKEGNISTTTVGSSPVKNYGREKTNDPSKYELPDGSRVSASAKTRGQEASSVPSTLTTTYYETTTFASVNIIQQELGRDDDIGGHRISKIRHSATAFSVFSPVKTFSFAGQHQELDENTLDGPSSNMDNMERVFKRMQQGFRVLAYLSSRTQPALLHLDEDRMNILISPIHEGAKNESSTHPLVKIRIDQIYKLELGRAGTTAPNVQHSKLFSIATGNGVNSIYFDFEAESPLEREHLASTLMIVLEGLYNQNDEIRQEQWGNEKLDEERRDSEAGAFEVFSVSSSDITPKAGRSKGRAALHELVIDEEEEIDGGTVDQPILCSPSLEITNSSLVSPLSNSTNNDLYGSRETQPSDSREEIAAEGYALPASGNFEVGAASFETRDEVQYEERGPQLSHQDEDEDDGYSYSEAAERPDFMEYLEIGVKRKVQRARDLTQAEYSDEPIGLIVNSHEPSQHSYLSDPPILVKGELVSGEEFDMASQQVTGRYSEIRSDFGELAAFYHVSANIGTTAGPLTVEKSTNNALVERREHQVGVFPAYLSAGSFSGHEAAEDSHRILRTYSMPETRQDHLSGTSPTKPIIIDEGRDRIEGIYRESYSKRFGTHFYSEHDNDSNDARASACDTIDLISRSPPSFDLGTAPSQQLEGQWCSDDFCTSTFRDMAQTCSGIFTARHVHQQEACFDTTLTEQQMLAAVQEYVNNALGAPSAMYEYFTEDTVPEEPGDETEPRFQASSSRVQNRAGLRNAQAGRYRNLRKEMTFHSALKQSRDYMKIRTTQSFNDAQPRMITNRAANAFLGSALLGSVVANMTTQGRSIDPPTNVEDDDVAYYDSDPEDTREQKLYKGPRRASAQIKIVRGQFPAEKRAQPPGLGKVRNKLSRKVDEGLVKEIVQVMQNDRLTLMWHPTQSIDQPNRAPTVVRLWIESGLQLADGSFLLPKLTWTKVDSSDLKGIKKGQLHKLDLLDITRIRSVENINREKHPFASRRLSFVIESQSEVYLFEAETTEERERVVYGLKVVVARLASLLMLRDYRAAEEFFGSPAFSVPGQSPI